MLDFLLDTTTNDISFPEGDVAMVAGVDEIKQANRLNLGLFLQEWFDDPDAGIPYMQYVFQKAATYSDRGERGISDLTIEAIFRQKIMEVEGNDSIVQYAQTINKATRALALAYTVKSDEGEIPIEEVLTWLSV